MNKFKTFALCLAYLLLALISLPFVMLTLICGLVIYGTLRVESSIVCEIWEDDLTDSWNKFVNEFAKWIDTIKDSFLMEMELF